MQAATQPVLAELQTPRNKVALYFRGTMIHVTPQVLQSNTP